MIRTYHLIVQINFAQFSEAFLKIECKKRVCVLYQVLNIFLSFFAFPFSLVFKLSVKFIVVDPR